MTILLAGTNCSRHTVAQAVFNNPQDKTKVTLLFGNISEEDILLRKEWECECSGWPSPHAIPDFKHFHF